MILPDKHEDINKTIVVLAYRIIKMLGKKNYRVFNLYNQVNAEYRIDLFYFYDILTFLWLLDAIEINFNIISLSDDLKKNLHRS